MRFSDGYGNENMRHCMSKLSEAIMIRLNVNLQTGNKRFVKFYFDKEVIYEANGLYDLTDAYGKPTNQKGRILSEGIGRRDQYIKNNSKQ